MKHKHAFLASTKALQSKFPSVQFTCKCGDSEERAASDPYVVYLTAKYVTPTVGYVPPSRRK